MGDRPTGESSHHAASEHLWAIIPAGGAGTRLWPLSRAARPKFLLSLLGNRSLLQQTLDRIAPLVAHEQSLVVCGPAHAAPVARQLPELPDGNILVEPAPRGSGPAIALATAIVALRDPDAIVMSFAADHEVTDEAAFLVALEIAIAAARDDWLVTIGLAPTRPETGYGYIERTDEAIVSLPLGDAFRVSRFVEKPDETRAAQYIASGRYLWNASMFIWRARALLAEVRRLQPEVADGVARIARAWGTPAQDRVTADVWATMPESTIDQGILEQAQRIAVVPANLGWSDVGDWNNIGDLVEQDDAGNSVRGEMVQSMTHDCVVWSETDRLIALVGLDNIAVVDTDDALLVVDRKHAQEVRRIVDQLKATYGRGF